MLKLFTWPFWLPMYFLKQMQEDPRKHWSNQDNNVFFGTPYPKGQNFYDKASPFDGNDGAFGISAKQAFDDEVACRTPRKRMGRKS